MKPWNIILGITAFLVAIGGIGLVVNHAPKAPPLVAGQAPLNAAVNGMVAQIENPPLAQAATLHPRVAGAATTTMPAATSTAAHIPKTRAPAPVGHASTTATSTRQTAVKPAPYPTDWQSWARLFSQQREAILKESKKHID